MIAFERMCLVSSWNTKKLWINFHADILHRKEWRLPRVCAKYNIYDKYETAIGKKLSLEVRKVLK